jgi:uncharacterized protein (DUF1499 family)
VTERPRIRARAKLPPLRRWGLRGVLLAAVVLSPYAVTYSQPAPELGVMALGGLKPCPQSPNCVCTEWKYLLASGATFLLQEGPSPPTHYVDPIELVDGSIAHWNELVEVVRRQPGVKIVEKTDYYLHAERSTTIYGLIDDFELARLANGTVLIRSAARLAYSDFKRNRRFAEKIRAEFEKRPREQWF